MFYPDYSEFINLSKQGNLIPVFAVVPADVETPVSAFLKIQGKQSFLLESVENGENLARYSFMGTDPIEIYTAQKENPYSELKNILKKYNPVKIEGLPDFHGGAVGYFSYDSIRFIENIPSKNTDELNIPSAQFMLTDTILAFDHVLKKIYVIANAYIQDNPETAYQKATAKIEKIIAKLQKPLPKKKYAIGKIKTSENFKSNYQKTAFENIVRKAQQYIKDGDIFQVVLAQRFSREFTGNAFDLYRKLRMINPSPYMFYLDFADMQVVGSSPEVLVGFKNGTASVRPIAGTRKRGQTKAEDLALEKELLADTKERAEHLMLLDLGRNDLGRVCEYGSVQVSESFVIERYSHVMHIVSQVEGQLQKDKDRFDLIQAVFPAGTVSGAPKVRAMEIIDELENTKRGLYAGTIGYFDFSGNLDSCIAIRTLLVKNKKVHLQAGAGIVADSIPEKEYEETLNKAGALMKIFGDENAFNH